MGFRQVYISCMIACMIEGYQLYSSKRILAQMRNQRHLDGPFASSDFGNLPYIFSPSKPAVLSKSLTFYFTPIKAMPFLACKAAFFSACSSRSVHLTLNWSHLVPGVLYSLFHWVCMFCSLLISRGSPLPL